jgi:hypothetical protein
MYHAPPNKNANAPAGNGGAAEEIQDRQSPFIKSATPLQRYHVDSVWRRPKTLQELRDGCELVELYDRRFPGRMAGRARR